MNQIPFKNQFPSFTEEITLEGIPYIFRFDWNSRAFFWSMDIYDRERNPLLSGRKLFLYLGLLKQFPDRGLPPGEIYIVDLSYAFEPIAQFDFESRLFMYYLTEAEVATL